MPSLSLFLWATPAFGLALTPPVAAMPAELLSQPMRLVGASQEPEPSIVAVDAGEATSDDDAYAEDLRRREAIVAWHRPLGIATWASMTLTLVLGDIQYYNLYGFFAGEGDNPCVRGDAIFGRSQCTGTPWPHLISAGVTGALYLSTLTLAALMPDPDDAAEGDSAYARNVRMHRLLRWVHLGGMLAQMALGVLTANAGWIGLDRANDYGTLQALATVHMGIGLVTYGALTWAGALMIF